MYFLLSTLPERARKGYLRKLSVSVHFWRTKGGCLSDSTIQKLIDAKVPIIVMDNSEKGFHHLNEDWEQYYNPLEK